MKVKTLYMPENSLIMNYLPADHQDIFKCDIIYDGNINPDDIMISFCTELPTWVDILFKVRNNLVKLIGLKNSGRNNHDELEKCIRTGQDYSFISVPAKNEDETVLLLKDKHLDAYMSVYIDNQHQQQKKISLTTIVHYNNKLGNFYFFIIKPFHNIVVRSMLKRSIKKMVSGS